MTVAAAYRNMYNANNHNSCEHHMTDAAAYRNMYNASNHNSFEHHMTDAAAYCNTYNVYPALASAGCPLPSPRA